MSARGLGRLTALGLALVLYGAVARGQSFTPLDGGEDDATPAAAPSSEPAEAAPQPPAPLEPGEAKRIEAALERAAKLPNDQFCHSRSVPFSRDRRLCAFADAAARRCPEFRAACRGESQEQPEVRGALASLAGLLRILGYVLLAALIVGAVWAVLQFLRRLLGGTALPAAPDQTLERAPSPVTPEESSPDRNVQRRLQRARELAGQQNYAAALSELHAAVILALDARGLIEARKGRTNGDYARELAAQPELSAAFREVARSVESVQFGARTADRSLFERAFGRASALVGPGLVALGLGLLLSVTGCNRQSARAGSSAAGCGTSAKGYSFLCSALEETRGARRRYRSLSTLDQDVAVLVIVADELNEDDASTVVYWVADGGTAVLTRWFPEIDKALEIERSGPPCGGEVALLGAGPTDAKLVVDPHPSLRASKLQSYADCGAGVVAAHGDYSDGQVVVLSSPSLLSNASLAAGSNAELLLRMIPRLHGSMEIVGNWTGRSADSPFASLRAAGLLPWLGHLALLGFAFARYRGTPFARRHALREDPRRRFVEHVQALGDRWADARASRVALAAYAAWGFEALRDRTSRGAQASLSELADVLARRSGHPPDAVLRTLAKSRLAQEGDDGASEAEHLETLRALGKLISEAGGSRWT